MIPTSRTWRALTAAAFLALAGSLVPAHAEDSPNGPAPAVRLAQAVPTTPPAASPPAAMPPLAAGPPDGETDTAAGQTVQLAARSVLATSGSAEWDSGFQTIRDAHDKIRKAMTSAGVKPAGRPLAVFLETDDQGFRYDAMIPVDGAIDGSKLPSDVRATTSPAGKTMKFEHRGAYDDIDSTYEAITAYLDEKMMEARNLFVEEYLNDVATSDNQDLQVDIYVFVK